MLIMVCTLGQTPEGIYWPRISLQPSEGPEHTKAAMCRTRDHKCVHRRYEPDELHDLRSDPGEEQNLDDDPAYAATLAQLKDRLLTWYQDTADVVPTNSTSAKGWA